MWFAFFDSSGWALCPIYEQVIGVSNMNEVVLRKRLKYCAHFQVLIRLLSIFELYPYVLALKTLLNCRGWICELLRFRILLYYVIISWMLSVHANFHGSNQTVCVLGDDTFFFAFRWRSSWEQGQTYIWPLGAQEPTWFRL